MKMHEALSIINGETKTGFRVHFERVEGHGLQSDYFPDRDEQPISTEEEAWQMAKKFADNAPCDYCNIYVVDGHFKPVDGYRSNAYRNRKWK